MTSPFLESPPRTSLPAEDQEFIDGLINRYLGRPGMLLGLLEDIQAKQPGKYLSLETLEYLASKTGIPASRIYSVATFYSLFNLTPQGEHTVCICRGTACHTRGSRQLLDRTKLQLGLNSDEDQENADQAALTTRDRKFTLRTVACFGQCALAPVVEVDHAILGHVNEQGLEREVSAIQKGGRN